MWLKKEQLVAAEARGARHATSRVGLVSLKETMPLAEGEACIAGMGVGHSPGIDIVIDLAEHRRQRRGEPTADAGSACLCSSPVVHPKLLVALMPVVVQRPCQERKRRYRFRTTCLISRTSMSEFNETGRGTTATAP
jgi:hypothetical protein